MGQPGANGMGSQYGQSRRYRVASPPAEPVMNQVHPIPLDAPVPHAQSPFQQGRSITGLGPTKLDSLITCPKDCPSRRALSAILLNQLWSVQRPAEDAPVVTVSHQMCSQLSRAESRDSFNRGNPSPDSNLGENSMKHSILSPIAFIAIRLRAGFSLLPRLRHRHHRFVPTRR